MTLMRFICAVVFTVALPGQLFAEEPTVALERLQYDQDFNVLSQCIDNAQSIDEARNCQRTTVLICEGRITQDASRVQSSDCIRRENRMWNRLRQAAFQQVLAGAVAWDLGTNGKAFNGNDAFKGILVAEVAWEDFARAQCAIDNLHYGAGTARSTADPACRGRMLAERVYVLRAHSLLSYPNR